MWAKNQFNLEPGTYRHKGIDWIVVVTEITTHRYNGVDMVEIPDPVVTFRELQMKSESYITYSMTLSEFKDKFHSI